MRRRRLWYNKNHLVKSKHGIRPAGYQRRFKRQNWRGNRGFRNVRKQLQVDQPLRNIIGVERAHWGQIVRLIWNYIKANNLQSPQNKKMIVPDQALAAVIGAEEINCFKMMSHIKRHIVIE
jgi:chromatin remodeling complex protein RSC6